MTRVTADPVLEQRVADCLVRAVSSRRIVGGVVLVARDREPVVETVAGFADRETGRKMTADTIFGYSSVTKPIVAAAAMVFVERGIVDLDDPITRWLPEFRPKLPNGDVPDVRVRHLLTHTVGLTYRMLHPTRLFSRAAQGRESLRLHVGSTEGDGPNLGRRWV